MVAGHTVLRAALLFSLGVAACAEPLNFGEVCALPGEMFDGAVTASDPSSALRTCAERQDLSTMRVALEAQSGANGASEMTITLDPTSLRADGVVSGLVPERDTNVLLVYQSGNAFLALRAAKLDMTGADCVTNLSFDLDLAGVLLFAPEDLLSMQTPTWPGQGKLSEAARRFVVQQVGAKAVGFDDDGDGCPNLAEACMGTLGDASRSACDALWRPEA